MPPQTSPDSPVRPPFNLVHQPWIPVLAPHQPAPQLLSLQDTLLQAHELVDIWGDSPLETAALYRFLLAVLHRSLAGPRDAAAWTQLWHADHFPPDVLTTYLEQWQERFDLFHPDRPFLQTHNSGRPTAVHHLVFSQGHSATLFTHFTDATGLAVPAAQAARQLITVQHFGLGGLSGLPQNFTDSPCARGIVFLAQGATLFETLMLNLLPYPADGIFPWTPQDAPLWEQDDPFRPRNVPYGYLDYLTWPARQVLLTPAGHGAHLTVRTISRAPGLVLSPGVANPQHHYRRSRQEQWYALRFNADRATWRDSMALYHLNPAAQTTPAAERPPAVRAWLAQLVAGGHLAAERMLRWQALGMASSKSKVEFVRRETLPLPLAYLAAPQIAEQLGAAMQLATAAAQVLWFAARTMAGLIVTPTADPGQMPPATEPEKRLLAGWAIERTYWAALEQDWWRLVNDLPSSPQSYTTWPAAVESAAVHALANAQARGGDTPRSLKAHTIATGLLYGRLRRLQEKEPAAEEPPAAA